MASAASNGIVIGVVSDLDDPDTLGRVRVTFPHLDDSTSDWARIAVPMAGGGRGFFFRPEIDDEVLVAFEHGDPRRPYVVGSLWSQVDQPPADDGDATANNWRFITSRSGHMLKLDDTAGGERIEIVDKDGSRKVTIDSAGQRITIDCGAGDVEVKASQNVTVSAQQSVTVSAQGDMTLEAQGALTLSGRTVDIN